MFEDGGDMNDFMDSFNKWSGKESESYGSSSLGPLASDIVRRVANIEKMKLLLDSYKYGDKLIQEEARIVDILNKYCSEEFQSTHPEAVLYIEFYEGYRDHLSRSMAHLKKTIRECQSSLNKDRFF